MSMTDAEWQAEVFRRIGISEGCRSQVYLDTQGIPTVGIGFNLERPDAREIITKIGADYDAVCNGAALSQDQIRALFDLSFAPILSEARASLASGVYDFLSDARRFVICDLVFNLGPDGWLSFVTTRALINQAQQAKDREDTVAAHVLFRQAANHLLQSAYARQVGNRAKRNAAMLASSVWADAEGDGSDVL